MADTGAHFPAPDGWSRIKRSDLRVECMKCGGDGREWAMRPDPKTGFMARRHVGPCKACAGMARLYPRKLPG